MFKSIGRSFVVLFVLMIMTGVLYPLLLTRMGQLLFPFQANGSIINKNGKMVGSVLIGQGFLKEGYFHGRPSVVDSNAGTSAASNWGPTSAKLKSAVEERIAVVRQENFLDNKQDVPADLVLSSASGLDPHISLPSALLQADRVAKERKILKQKVIDLIHASSESKPFGFLGGQRVNVLKLNLSLEAISEKSYE